MAYFDKGCQIVCGFVTQRMLIIFIPQDLCPTTNEFKRKGVLTLEELNGIYKIEKVFEMMLTQG